MKMRLLAAIVGWVISIVLPTFAQQKEPTLSEQDRQQLGALGAKFDQAENNNDAAALAALYTKDALLVTDKGPIYGRQAIEKWYADDFQEWHHSSKLSKSDLNSVHIMSDSVASSGAWSVTIQGKSGGPIQLEGYWSNILTREGNNWKIRISTYNITPAPAAPAQTK